MIDPDPTTELGAVIAAYELTLTSLVTTPAQCRTLFDDLLIHHANVLELLLMARQREKELTMVSQIAGVTHES